MHCLCAGLSGDAIRKAAGIKDTPTPQHTSAAVATTQLAPTGEYDEIGNWQVPRACAHGTELAACNAMMRLRTSNSAGQTQRLVTDAYRVTRWCICSETGQALL